MANELAIAMRDAGTELAETFANRDSSGSRTRYGTVTANNGATLDVKLAGGSVSGVPMTTACVGARAGDRVLLTVDGPLITATGILASGDNGPYVILYSSDARPGTYPRTVSGSVSIRQFAFLEIMGSTSEWTRCYCKVPGISFGDGTFGYDTMMFSLKAFNGGDKRAFIKMSRFVITDDGKSWSIGPKDYN